jgi:hypothetical protein
MAQDFAAMVRESSKKVGAETSPSTSGESVEESTGGIQIERQDAEHVRGQAKSGL